jgi:hypothetical protein
MFILGLMPRRKPTRQGHRLIQYRTKMKIGPGGRVSTLPARHFGAKISGSDDNTQHGEVVLIESRKNTKRTP